MSANKQPPEQVQVQLQPEDGRIHPGSELERLRERVGEIFVDLLHRRWGKAAEDIRDHTAQTWEEMQGAVAQAHNDTFGGPDDPAPSPEMIAEANKDEAKYEVGVIKRVLASFVIAVLEHQPVRALRVLAGAEDPNQ